MPYKLDQTLPPKEMALFRKAIRLYEQSQYKMALRCTKQILSDPKFAEHGETLSMHGLILSCTGKFKESLEIARRGLTADLRSFICWHIFGQVQRSNKNYDEAIKAYKMALRLDNNNLQILRDLSLSQIHVHDYLGYRDSCYQLLSLRPENKFYLMGYASACHMLGDYNMALKIIDEYLGNKKNNNVNDPEYENLVHYKVTILQEADRLQDALDFLEKNCDVFLDRLTYFETCADLLFKLGKIAEAEDIYMLLLDRNCDCASYIKRIEECKSILSADKPDEIKKINKEFYENLLEKYPRSRVIKLRSFLFMEKDEFQTKLLEYVIAGLRSGLPSLFNCVLMFYEKNDMTFVEKLLTDFVEKCEQQDYEKVSLDGSSLQELPSTLVWVFYYLAQHFLWFKKFDIALQHIEKAIDHTPTLVDLYTMKAKIYKKSGDSKQAAEIMDYAQSLDTADRYLNCKCTKYFLEAGRIEEASKMCERFTRKGIKSEDALYEMQCLWYPLAHAKSYLAQNNYGEALKHCHRIDEIVTSYYNDQYDFHSYSMRKCYLSPYVSMLHFLGKIHNNEYFVRAAKIATKIYLLLNDSPKILEEKPKNDDASVSAAELKKLRRKANKQKAQEEKTQDEKSKSTAKKQADADVDFVESTSLDPAKLVATKTPLDDAAKFLQPAMLADSTDPELYELAFEVYKRKQKVLLMLKCLNKLRKIDAKNAKLSAMLKTFQEEYAAQKAVLSKSVVELVEDFMPKSVLAG